MSPRTDPCPAHRDVGSSSLDCERPAGHKSPHAAGPWRWENSQTPQPPNSDRRRPA